MGATGAATSGGVSYHDWPFPDGYVYRQYKDGSILLLKSPKGGAGTVLYEDTPNPGAWRAITAEIAKVKAGRVATALHIGDAVATSILKSMTPKKRKRAQQRTSSVTPAPEQPQAQPDIPWIPIGLGAFGLVAVMIISGGRK